MSKRADGNQLNKLFCRDGLTTGVLTVFCFCDSVCFSEIILAQVKKEADQTRDAIFGQPLFFNREQWIPVVASLTGGRKKLNDLHDKKGHPSGNHGTCCHAF
jgi:hypothetical protein